MTEFLQIMLNGVAAGSGYALMGIAMVIIYKTSEVVNFAQGEMALASVFFTYMILRNYGVPFVYAMPLAALFAVFVGCVLEFAVLRRARRQTTLGMIIVTIGLEMILMGLVSWKFGADHKVMPFPITEFESIWLGGFYVTTLEAVTFSVVWAVMLGLFVFYRYTRLGLIMKATQQNRSAAKLMGVRTNRVLMFTWGLSSLVGCIAGLLLAPRSMEPFMMWDPMLKGFAGAVVGGMTSIPGAVFGAYFIGIVENLFGRYASMEFKSAVAFALIVIVLCVKPSGIFSRHYVKKV
ncbi:branched-chain amino acid ABC transporter permease [Desulfatibacillum aliphaticivorans]|uniref:branched-chain amino acid ABC transporter permease n=1 Tax=Desulfatibacillum aliphaticivorans TaxID=218208 RepID=UPI00047FB556|nr:branched-chain amino acid ABC transporter permease [Desulfatibacillum aliphaticivorans]